MALLHSPALFLDDEGDGLHFVIKSGPLTAEVEELIKAVTHGHGLIYEKATEYSMTFAPPDYEVVGDEELYSYKYIKDCCDKNRLLDLTSYRLNKQSKYPNNFNPTDVFLKYTTWEDALQGKPYKGFQLPPHLNDLETDSPNLSDTASPVTASPQMRKKRINGLKKKINVVESSESEFSDEEYLRKLETEDELKNKEKETSSSHVIKEEEERKRQRESDSDNVDSNIAEASSVKKTVKVSRREYTESERKSIINYIIRNKAYSHVKGREFWQQMEEKQICPGRTWQSLKEHFIKKILPRIDTFGLPEEEVRELKNNQ